MCCGKARRAVVDRHGRLVPAIPIKIGTASLGQITGTSPVLTTSCSNRDLFCPMLAILDTIRGNKGPWPDRESLPSPKFPASPPGASPPTSSMACCGGKLALDEQLSGKSAHLGLADLPDRDRALDAAAGRHRAAAARHLAPFARRLSRQGLSRRRAAHRNHSADRRGADPLARRARPRRRRPVGAAGARRPPRRALCRTGQCGAAPGRPGARRRAGR